jgi:hypothetical protein
LVSKKVDDFQSMLDNSACHQLLSAIASLAHQAADKALDDWARCLAKSLLLVSASSVWQVNGMISLARDVILKIKQTKVSNYRNATNIFP